MMLPAAAIPMALSAIKALLRYRERVDEVLSLSAATEGLPFRLPPAPNDPWPHENSMLAFFQTDHGKVILEVNNLTGEFQTVLSAYQNNQPRPVAPLNNCFALYFEAKDINPSALLPPGVAPGELRKYASTGPSEEMRLAYYIVESDRLSRNPALTRVILITADTLLEVVGENANYFISSQKTRSLVEDLLREFAVNHDFDDESAADIFKQLLGATALAALDNPGVLPNEPALRALYGALNEVRQDLKQKHGDEKAREIISRLVTKDGFERIVNAYMTQVAKDPSFVTSNELAQKAIKAVLLEVEGKFFDLFKEDPDARYRVVEAVLSVGADHVLTLLKKEVGPGRPFSAAILSSVVTHVKAQANQHSLFEKIANGEVLGDIYAVALTAVANNPGALSSEAEVSEFVSELVTALAAALSNIPPLETLEPESRVKLLSGGLRTVARHPEVLTRDNKFASKILAAVINTTVDVFGDGLDTDDFEALLVAALRAAGDNISLLELDDVIVAVLKDVTAVVANNDFNKLLSPSGQRDLLLEALKAVAANPIVWKELKEQDLVQPLVSGLIQVAQQGVSQGLISEPTVVESFRLTLLAASRRGRNIIHGGQNVPTEIVNILEEGLKRADEQLGRTLDGENLPGFFQRVLLEFLKAPFVIAVDPAKVDEIFEDIGRRLEEL